MDMFTSYGHIIKLKYNHRFFDDFKPGHVPLIVMKINDNLPGISYRIKIILNGKP